MASILKLDTLQTPSGTGNISIPTGTRIVSPDVAGLVAPGHIIQVVNNYSSATVSGSGGTWVTGPVSASITPKFSNSKILVFFELHNMYVAAGPDVYLRVLSNGTVITPNTEEGNARSNVQNMASNRQAMSITNIHAPGSTSQQTYTVQGYISSGTLYMNYPSDRGQHFVTLMEIAQ